MGNSFFQNTCKPVGFAGKIVVNMMNNGHEAMARWGFTHVEIGDCQKMLDIGCGGGANVARMLAANPNGKVYGVDYSEVSVEKTGKVNKKAIEEGRCEIRQANVLELPFEDNQFDMITAFETIYFWPDIVKSFEQVLRVLKPEGKFMICNEAVGTNPSDEKWTKMIDGMTIYRPAEVKKYLEQAGFTEISINTNQKGWMAVVAGKGQR